MKLNILVAGCLFAAAVAMPAAAQEKIYTAELIGSNEVPQNNSPATGTATVTVDLDDETMRVQQTFSGLLAPTTVSHIHCCTPMPNSGTAAPATQVPTFPGFPVGVTSGSYDQTFDMSVLSSYNPDFVSANGGTAASAFDALVEGFDNRTAYANIHSEMFQGGEIRGTLVPEPETYAMLLAGLALVSAMARRRRV